MTDAFAPDFMELRKPPQWDYAGAPWCCVDIKLDRIAMGLPPPSMGYAPCNKLGRAFVYPHPDEHHPASDIAYYCPFHEHVGRTVGMVPDPQEQP